MRLYDMALVTMLCILAGIAFAVFTEYRRGSSLLPHGGRDDQTNQVANTNK